jgi:hypothetical protein
MDRSCYLRPGKEGSKRLQGDEVNPGCRVPCGQPATEEVPRRRWRSTELSTREETRGRTNRRPPVAFRRTSPADSSEDWRMG